MGQIATAAYITRLNLIPPPSPGAPPAALPPGNTYARKWAAAAAAVSSSSARSVPATLSRASSAPAGGNGASTPTVNQGPLIGVGGPPAPGTEAAAIVANLSPGARTLIKIAPFVAAAWFWHSGNRTLAAVSAAGGVAAAVWL